MTAKDIYLAVEIITPASSKANNGLHSKNPYYVRSLSAD